MESIKQLTKFAIVGCLNVAVSFAVFVLCYEQLHLGTSLLGATGAAGAWVMHALDRLGVHAIDAAAANLVGYLAGMVNSFICNKAWTFEAQGRTISQARRFVTLNLVGLVGSTLIMFVLVDALGMPYLPVLVVTIVIVTVFHFLGNKYWTFAGALRQEGSGGQGRDPCPNAD